MSETSREQTEEGDQENALSQHHIIVLLEFKEAFSKVGHSFLSVRVKDTIHIKMLSLDQKFLDWNQRE